MTGTYQDVVANLESLISSQQSEMHTAIPATVLSFDKKTGRATVQPKGKLKVDDETYMNYPQLNDVPVVFPYCSALTAGVAFPLQIGDSCLLIFCEQALDTWLGSGDTSSELQYSLTNAIAIPGLMKFSVSALSEAVDDKSIILYNGKTKIKVGKEKVTISGNVEIDGNLTVSGSVTGGE